MVLAVRMVHASSPFTFDIEWIFYEIYPHINYIKKKVHSEHTQHNQLFEIM